MSFNIVNKITGELTHVAGKGIKGDPGTGLLPHFIIVSDVGSTVTVTTPSGDTITPEAVSTDHWECDVPEYGVYIIDAVLSGDDARVTVTVDDVKIYTIDDSHFHASITATFPNGASCRCYKDSVVYYATSTPYTFSVNSAGTWTVECTYNGISKSQTVTITTEGQSESTTIEYASIEVTYVDAIKGLTISCTDGTTTYTKTAPSSSNTVTFTIPTTGNWTVSTTDGTLVSSETVTVSSMTSYSVELTFGFDYKQWVTLGGLDPTDYTDLEDVLADEVAVRRLMTVHASADYLITCVTDDIDTIDDFTANDTAMKWIGLRDYVCDGLTAITGVEAKFLASQYWERYLKDHVPTMTSNTAPYGTAIASNYRSGYDIYKAFDRKTNTAWNCTSTTSGAWIGYEFINPINVRRIFHFNGNGTPVNTFKIQYSDDNSTWNDTGDSYTINLSIAPDGDYFDVTDCGYHKYWRIYQVSSTVSSDCDTKILQFYGRSLNVSVPVMTSNTAPYGIASASSEYSNLYQAYKAFDGDNADNSYWQGTNASSWLQYDFGNKVSVKRFYVKMPSTSTRTLNCQLKGSNDGITFESISGAQTTLSTSKREDIVSITNNEEYRYYRMEFSSSDANVVIVTLQLYGLDYTEKEFEQGATKKWLYDHGVELETLIDNISGGGTVTRNDDNIVLFSDGGYTGVKHEIDLTPYSMYCGILETIESYVVSASDPSAIGIQIGDGVPGSSGVVAYSRGTTNIPPTKWCIDISSFNETKYARAYVYRQKAYLTELWLE